MKMNYASALAVVAAGALALSGCSVLGFQNKTEKAEKVTASQPQPGQSAGSKTNAQQTVQTAISNTNSNKDLRKKNKNDKNRQHVSAANEQRVHGQLAGQLAGEWAITAVSSTIISVDEDVPYMNFVPAENSFYGSNGCNVLNGSYTLNGDKLTFGPTLSTMKYCEGLNFDNAINNVVKEGATVHINIKKIGNQTYLYINDNAGKSLMTLVRHNMQFLNGNWQVTSINNKEIDDEEANIFFDIASLKLHGNTGCNYFNGNILIDPAVPNSISFSGMGVTRMACPNGDQERMMLVALEETATATAGRNTDTAILKDANGKTLMTLKRIPLAEGED